MNRLLLFPDARLKQLSTPLELADFNDEFRAQVRLMLDLVEPLKGYALAAPQLGVHKRFFVIANSPELQLFCDDVPRVMVNPEILSAAAPGRFKESCLSLPGVSAWNDRNFQVLVRYRDTAGFVFTRTFHHTLAVVIQHEIDHLDGKLFIDQLTPFEHNRVVSRINKLRRR